MENKEVLKELLRRSLARQTLLGFTLYTFPEYQAGWVHEEICQKLDYFLDKVKRKESPRLMLTMPPRSGKTEIASRRFPAYVLGRYPDTSIIATSYSSDLASRNNRDVQRVIDDNLYHNLFPDTTLFGKNIRSVANGSYLRNSDIFEVVGHKGVYKSAGVGAGITGMGGDILIIDDVFKDRQEADSPTIRDKVYNWYTSTLYTRLAPGGGILIIMTRWHHDDLCGRLLEKDKDTKKWEVIEYPAIATHDEPHRKKGEALHPERYPLEELLRIKSDVGSRDWEALYQQRPTIDGGAVFKEEWIKYWTTLPNSFDTMIISWDMTFKGADTNDYVVGQVWGRKGSECYFIDQVRKHMTFTEALQAFIDLSNKYPRALKKLVEDKANGPAVIDVLKKHVQGIVTIIPKESKVARAYAVTPMWEAGNVYIPSPLIAPWIKDYKTELTNFPVVAHDDQVDATTQALRELQQRKPMKINPSLFRR